MSAEARRLIVALDLPDPGRAGDLTRLLAPLGVGFKVGLELFMSGGEDLVGTLALRHDIFLDLKFHDIPHTVAAAARRAAEMGVAMFNVHAAGGREMMLAAREAIEGPGGRPLLVAVTVLTSLGPGDLAEAGFAGGPTATVTRLAALAASCGLDGVVCSPLEIAAVKKSSSGHLITVTPGIRPAGAGADDQARAATPRAAIAAGGDYLVVGRPVTRARDPLSAARNILGEMGGKP